MEQGRQDVSGRMELIAARWEEFDLDGAVWHLPGERTKTGATVDIPLPAVTVEWLRELQRLGVPGQEDAIADAALYLRQHDRRCPVEGQAWTTALHRP
jgi:integrase